MTTWPYLLIRHFSSNFNRIHRKLHSSSSCASSSLSLYVFCFFFFLLANSLKNIKYPKLTLLIKDKSRPDQSLYSSLEKLILNSLIEVFDFWNGRRVAVVVCGRGGGGRRGGGREGMESWRAADESLLSFVVCHWRWRNDGVGVKSSSSPFQSISTGHTHHCHPINHYSISNMKKRNTTSSILSCYCC